MDDDGNVKSVPIPFALGELYGSYLTKEEHTCVIMTKILLKMELTGHVASKALSSDFVLLVHKIFELRTTLWGNYTLANPGPKSETVAAHVVCREMTDLVQKMSRMLQAFPRADDGPFKLWQMFLIMFDFLGQAVVHVCLKGSENLGYKTMELPDDLRLVVAKAPPSSDHEEVWKKVLELLDHNLVIG